VRRFGRIDEVPELGAGEGGPSPLQQLCERWMIDDRQPRRR